MPAHPGGGPRLVAAALPHDEHRAGRGRERRPGRVAVGAEGNPLDLAKARALGDALVRIQRPSGYIPTEYALVEKRDDPMQGWLNCTCATLAALDELAALDGE